MPSFSNRLGKLAPYPFVEISRIIAEKRAAGADVVTFGIGDPDIPTPQYIVDRLLTASQDPPNHRYPGDRRAARNAPRHRVLVQAAV